MTDDAASLLQGRRYAVLLAMLVAGLVIQSFDVSGATGAIVYDLLGTALCVAIFLVVFEPGRGRRVVGTILCVVVVVGWLRHPLGPRYEHALSIAYQALVGVFFWVAVSIILRNLFRAGAVGAENVRGAICGYLIAGAAWSSVNALIYLLAPASFGFDPKVAGLAADWHGRTALFSYYSFAQMLTIGYADVTPLRAPATTFSLLAALFGVFYTAVVVSQLVAMARPARAAPPAGE
jgi:hypothetical protein